MFISKKGSQGINLNGATVELKGNVFTISKGTQKHTCIANQGTEIKIENGVCFVFNTKSAAFAGTDYMNCKNLVDGVNKPYTLELSVKGNGFKAAIEGSKLTLNVGLSHQVFMTIPTGITVVQDTSRKSTTKENVCYLILTCPNKNQLTAFASQIAEVRKPNPYTGTGIYIQGKYVRTKKSSKGK
jgi:large subunit ribosomal protein L6